MAKNGFIRAFWRRVEPYKNDYGRELPEDMPVEFSCAFDTAATLLESELEETKAKLRHMNWCYAEAQKEIKELRGDLITSKASLTFIAKSAARAANRCNRGRSEAEFPAQRTDCNC